jgi:predicted acylesterase/phospholipase RssA
MFASCASLPMRSYTQHDQANAIIADIPNARFWADDPEGLAAARPAPRTQASSAMLALSGGGDNGAYGAGFLNGWSQSGKRPEFAIVTGVSTGALIAPFAFLGTRYDDRLRAAFTSIGPHDIYKNRFPLIIPFSLSAARTKPLWRLINVYYSDSIIDEIGREHRNGRRLLVSTSNLDAQRGVIWNMGAIAASTSPTRYQLFRRILLASCAIPALFPPVIIETKSDEQRIREVHVDGSTFGPLLAIPPALSASPVKGSLGRQVHLYLVVNGQLGGAFKLAKGGILAIAQQSLSLATSSAAREQVTTAFLWSTQNAAQFHLTYIDADFDNGKPHANFETAYMRRLYDYGAHQGMRAIWLERPPEHNATKRQLVRQQQ